MKQQNIEISTKTILLTIALLIGITIIWLVRELLFSLFIAFMVMSVVKPLVVRLEKRGIRRSLSAFFIFILLFLMIGLAFYFIIPPLISDMSAFIKTFTSLLENADPAVRQYIDGKAITTHIPDITNKVIPFISNIFSNIVFAITTLFFSLYFILDEHFLKAFLQKFLKQEDTTRIVRIMDGAEKRLGAWFYAEIVLMTLIGTTTYIGLTLIGVRHALSLAVIAGLLEAMPVVGPIISAIPAFMFAVNQKFVLGLATVALYIVIQQLENNLFVPAIMKKAVGLNRILILIVLIVGGKLAGVLGLFIAIPVTLCIESVLSEIGKKKTTTTT